MLVYLDTLIGFAAVMLLISLIVTILTQMVSELVNHRGSNLRWGLKTLFENIDPVLYPQLTASANRLAHEVLTHPLISDSWLSGLWAVQWIEKAPLAGKLLGRLRLASAIRSNELTNILKQIASCAAPPGVLAPLTAAEWAALQADIVALLAAPNPASARALSPAAGVAAAAFSAIAGQAATPLLRESVSAIRGTAWKLEAWFGSMMDRVAQKFTMYMRLWTVLFAGAFALATGLSSTSLLSQLYAHGAGAARGGFDILKSHWPARPDAAYIAGVLITAALLSLGAPFWFNALKSMTNLRPILASKEQTKQP